MTWAKLHTSFKQIYKSLMFPGNGARGWTLIEIDQMDIHFFYELADEFGEQELDEDVYMSDVW